MSATFLPSADACPTAPRILFLSTCARRKLREEKQNSLASRQREGCIDLWFKKKGREMKKEPNSSYGRRFVLILPPIFLICTWLQSTPSTSVVTWNIIKTMSRVRSSIVAATRLQPARLAACVSYDMWCHTRHRKENVRVVSMHSFKVYLFISF